MTSTYISSDRATRLTNKIYRTVRTNFPLPEIPRYQPSRVLKRKGCELVVEKPEDHWKTHHIRRTDNTNRGLYSKTSEPYKCMGGNVVLDTYDLVYNALDCIGKQNVAESRKEAEVKHEISNPIIKTDGHEFDADYREGSGRAGYCKILDTLKTTGERRAAIRAGLSYEEHVRLVETRLADMKVKSDIFRSTFNEAINNDGRSSRSTSKSRITSGNTKKTIESNYIHGTMSERLDRLRRDNIDYLKCILEVIVILHNLKSRFLKSKVPLPAHVMRNLKRADGTIPKSKSIKLSKYDTKIQSTDSLTSTEFSNVMLNDIKSSLKSPSGMPIQRRSIATPPAFGVFGDGKRYSKVADIEEFKMETWEDIITLENRDRFNHHQIDGAQHLHTTSDMASSEIKWFNVSREPCKKSKQTPWQVILTERTSGESFKEKKSDKYTDIALVPHRLRKAWEKVKADLQKNCTSDVEHLKRQTIQYFHFKINSFDDLKSKSLFEKHLHRMRDTSGLTPVSAAKNEITEALGWFENLQVKIFNVMGSDEAEINIALLNLGRYSQMGVRSVPHCRAKLCILVMSMPAYDICKIPMQLAIRFVIENILNGQAEEFYHWLHLRKIPLVLVK